jgi:hypothetical protein
MEDYPNFCEQKWEVERSLISSINKKLCEDSAFIGLEKYFLERVGQNKIASTLYLDQIRSEIDEVSDYIVWEGTHFSEIFNRIFLFHSFSNVVVSSVETKITFVRVDLAIGSAFRRLSKDIVWEKLIRKSLTTALGRASRKERRHKLTGNAEKGEVDKPTVIYFPHKGIYDGKNFVKDQYYSANPGSCFYPENILHLSLGPAYDFQENTKEYYDEMRIPHDFLDYKRKSLIVIVRSIINYFRYCRFNELFSLHIFRILSIWVSVNCARANLVDFRSVSVALVGYDVLFPKVLAAALQMENIKVVANQERLLLPIMPSFTLLCDHYFVINRYSELIVNEKVNCSIGETVRIGAVRAGKILSHADLHDQKPERWSKTNYFVLVLDLMSSTNSYANGMTQANWGNNGKFYDDILRLAGVYRDCFFLIKGKDDSIFRVTQMESVVSRVASLPNVEVFDDFETWSPYQLAAIADFTIARHTSLGDEMLSCRKGVIFHDGIGFPSSLFDYGREIVTQNYYQLLEKFHKWYRDPAEYIDGITKRVEEIFDCTGSSTVHERLQRQLELILESR